MFDFKILSQHFENDVRDNTLSDPRSLISIIDSMIGIIYLNQKDFKNIIKLLREK